MSARTETLELRLEMLKLRAELERAELRAALADVRRATAGARRAASMVSRVGEAVVAGGGDVGHTVGESDDVGRGAGRPAANFGERGGVVRDDG
ncbi:MAG: hypothetical protein ACOY5V_10465, partial [Pseudomonadota bacterium]